MKGFPRAAARLLRTIAQDLGFAPRTVDIPWLEWCPIRAVNGKVWHRARAIQPMTADKRAACGEPVPSGWHFASAMGVGWNAPIQACPRCEALYAAAGSPPFATEVPPEERVLARGSQPARPHGH